MKEISLFLFLFISFSAFCQKWEWISDIPGIGLERAWDMCMDKHQNILVTGQFTDTLEINGVLVPPVGGSDIFVASFSKDGGLLWAKTFGGRYEDVALSIACDGNGNIYFSGYFNDTAFFQEQTVVSAGSWDMYVASLDQNGNIRWVQTSNGTQAEIAYGISVSKQGKVFFTGWYQGTISFGDGTILTNYGGSDILTGCYSPDGNLLWVRNAGSEGVDYGYKMASDSLENCYVTGVAGGTIIFDTLVVEIGGMYVAKYNSNGEIQWVLPSLGLSVNDISTDATGNGFVSGRYSDTGIFGEIVLNSLNATDDAYLARFTSNGEWDWAINIGCYKSDKGRAVEALENGGAFITGTFDSTLTIGDFALEGSGGEDIYLARVSANGNVLWANAAGGQYSEIATDVCFDADTNVYICGWYNESTQFGSIAFNSGTAGNINFFVARNTRKVSKISPIGPAGIQFFSNPVKELLHIQSDENVLKVQIFSLKGTLVFSKPAMGKELKLDVSSLSPGSYILEITTNQIHSSHLIVKE